MTAWGWHKYNVIEFPNVTLSNHRARAATRSQLNQILSALQSDSIYAICNRIRAIGHHSGPRANPWHSIRVPHLHRVTITFTVTHESTAIVTCLILKSGMGKLDMFSSHAMSATAVAKAGYEGYRKNEDVVIPGWKNRLMVTGIGFLPRFATRKIVGKMQGI